MARRKTATATSQPVLAAALPDKHLNDPAERLGNPLRGLTPLTAAALLSDAMRGCWTRAQWLMYYVEQWDGDVWTLVERRCAGLRQLDWTIRTDAEAEERGLEAQAEAQKETLHAWYSGVLNMREAVEFLALAKFRGYSHLAVSQSPVGSGQNVVRLEPVDQWWWVRDGLYGGWYYNPDAQQTTYHALGEPIDETEWVIRVEPRSLIWLAILKFLRANQSQKWWDRFCEEASRQGTVIVGPAGMTAEQQTAFETAALSIARSGSGVLANGSDVKRTGAEASTQTTVWEQRLRWLQEQLILSGTGGMLTALSQATGIGGSQGEEQGDVWRTLLRADAGDISEVLQEQLDRRILSAAFPGQPILAWFELDASEKPSTDQVLDHAVKAAQAGYLIDAEQLSERTGYDLEEKRMPPAAGGPGWPPGLPGTQAAADAGEDAARGGGSPASPRPGVAERSTAGEGKGLRNRAAAEGGAVPAHPADAIAEAAARQVTESRGLADWFAPVRIAVEAALRGSPDAETLRTRLDALLGQLPELSRQVDSSEFAAALQAACMAAYADGFDVEAAKSVR